MKLHSLIISKTEDNVLSPNVSVSDLYMPKDRSAYFLQPNRQTYPGNI